MATTYGQATYAEIIDDLRTDANEGAKLSLLPDRAIQKWILDAQEKICELVQVDDSYSLGLNEDVADYPFQERPAISGATNASPIVVTATAHGLSDDDRIYITGVLGNTAANGAFQIYSSDTNTFSLKQVWDVEDASNETPINIEVTSHGLSTGDSVTVADVEGNTAANGTWTITVVDVNNFTLDTSVGTATYTGAGTVTKVSSGNGAYTAGGRFWRDDELPIHLNRIVTVRRPWGDYFRHPKVCNIDYLLDQERRDTDGGIAFSTCDAPNMVAEYSKLGVRYLRFYPAPLENKTATVFGSMWLPARNYTGDALSATIMLPFQYEHLIRYHATMKMYEWLKDEKQSEKHLLLFEKGMAEFKIRKQSYTKLRVTYQ